MTGSDEQTLKQAIEQMLEQYHLDEKLLETRLIDSWKSVTGKVISRHTRNIYIHKKKLFVKIDSPAIKNELIYRRQKIMDLLHEKVGKKVVDEIIFL